MEEGNQPPETTLDSLAEKIDTLGAQMDWLCENMQGLFAFIEHMGKSGGGLRGLMSAMKNAPEMATTTVSSNDEKEVGISNG